jgi:hypothetical protein
VTSFQESILVPEKSVMVSGKRYSLTEKDIIAFTIDAASRQEAVIVFKKSVPIPRKDAFV